MSTPRSYLHPDYRVSAAAFESRTADGIQGSGLPAPQDPAQPVLTYDDVLSSLEDDAPGEGYQRAADLRDLTLRELGAALGNELQNFWDALAESEGVAQQVASALSKAGQSDTERYAAVGIAVVAAVRTYLQPLVLIDVQERYDHHADLDRLEDRLSHHERNTDSQEMAVELGLGRTLR